MRGQKPCCAFGIRDVCWMHAHAHQEPIGINPELPFAPVDLFSRILSKTAGQRVTAEPRSGRLPTYADT